MAVRILANASALLLRLTGKHLQGPNGLQMPIYPSGRIAAVVSVLEKMSQCPFGGWVVQKMSAMHPSREIPNNFTILRLGVAYWVSFCICE